MKSTYKFLMYLLACCTALFLLQWLLLSIITQDDVRIVCGGVIHTLYCFTPAMAALLVGGFNFGDIVTEYRLSIRGVRWLQLLKYFLATLILLPLCVYLLVYVFGNLLHVNGFGEVTFASLEMSLRVFPIGVVNGLTLGVIMSLGGEIGWRGFLERSVNLPRLQKYLLIGVIWWAWGLFPVAIYHAYIDFGHLISKIGVMLVLSVVLSFYYADALKSSNTLFASILMQGTIMSSPFLFVFNEGSNYLIVGNDGLLVAVVALILMFALRRRPGAEVA